MVGYSKGLPLAACAAGSGSGVSAGRKQMSVPHNHPRRLMDAGTSGGGGTAQSSERARWQEKGGRVFATAICCISAGPGPGPGLRGRLVHVTSELELLSSHDLCSFAALKPWAFCLQFELYTSPSVPAISTHLLDESPGPSSFLVSFSLALLTTPLSPGCSALSPTLSSLPRSFASLDFDYLCLSQSVPCQFILLNIHSCISFSLGLPPFYLGLPEGLAHQHCTPCNFLSSKF
jgi:hypothetical protein